MNENEDACTQRVLIDAATKIVTEGMRATLEARQALGDVLIAAQKFLERQFTHKDNC